ncbi:hypothetical protein H7X46_08990 [Pseudonocardia sp. C8]|uniref:hypothetical protein n=1 Tax=Pseudonocardia sp. C8 TaxID=2762759 RepID=UPI0016424FE1|nr:hypothetical protein [Pseudonocardia sp. C8]MBC3191194.1 hypothetical protein [Pseudonocardia sp. C8]
MTPDLTRAAEAIDRLLAELGPDVSREEVTAAVRKACDDLRGSPAGAMPELVERLARARLTAPRADV